MTAVEQCYDTTRKLIDILKDSKNRDQLISEVEQLLENRQSLLTSLKGPYSKEEMEMGKQVVIWNQEIDSKLSMLRNDIKRDMNGVSKKKTSVKKYTNPYESLQHDGMFYDKKK